MSNGRKAARSLIPLVAILLLAAIAPACGDSGSSAKSPSPTPAASVTALPGLTRADRKQDPAAYRALQQRALKVFIASGTSLAERHGMAERIASMPEVVAYHYVTKREALERARQMFERAGRSLPRMTVNPLPASFDILLRSAADVPIVAARFYDDPLVDNDPGTHNGVQARGGSALLQASPSPQ